MHVKLHSLVLIGLTGKIVEVEVDVAAGFPNFILVGLTDTVVQESKERVRSAIKNSGYRFPEGRVTVSLSPSQLRKDGAWFDLPIALGLLLASGQIKDPGSVLTNTVAIGEIGLDGTVRATGTEVAGVMSLRQRDWHVLVGNSTPTVIDALGVPVARVDTLRSAGEKIASGQLTWLPAAQWQPNMRLFTPLSAIAGLRVAGRAVEVALTGRHHLLLMGPPGTGKTLLSQYAAEWNPDCSLEELFQIGHIWSVRGRTFSFTPAPPVRSPHHTASAPAVIGGGTTARPGEISLSHRGILVLDELPEFRREVLEALREPMQEKSITISRAHETVTYPADCQIIATMNPCPCGYFGDQEIACRCSPAALERYRRKLSGPLMDRFEMVFRVDRISPEAVINAKPLPEDSILATRERVANARRRRNRLDLHPDARLLLGESADRFHLSGRAVTGAIQVAQSISALAKHESVLVEDIAEALQYRWRGWSGD